MKAEISARDWPYSHYVPKPNEFKEESELGKGQLPDPGVYILLQGEEIVYVGQSGDIAGRLRTHRREGKKQFDAARWYPVWSGSERLRAEGVLILLCAPRYNRAIALGLRSDGSVFSTEYAAWGARKKKATTKGAQQGTRKGVAKRAHSESKGG